MSKIQTRALCAIAEVHRGVSWSKSQECWTSEGEGVPVVRIGNVQPSGLDMSARLWITNVKASDAKAKRIRAGRTILMVGSNGNPGRIGNVYLADDRVEEHLFASFLIGVTAPDESTARYVLRVLQAPSIQTAITEATSGSTGLKNLSLTWLRNLEVPWPEEHMRRAIVDTATRCDGVAAAARLTADKAAYARDRVLSSAFAKWQPQPLGDGLVVKGGKRMPKGVPFAETETAHPYLRVLDMQRGTMERGGVVYVPDDVWPKIRRYVVRAGDVVISIVGTVGVVALVPEWADGANLTENAARFDAVPDDLDPSFLVHALRSTEGQQEIKRVTVGTTQPKLALFRVPLIQIPRPPREDQAAMADTCAHFEQLELALLRKAEAATALRDSLVEDFLAEVEASPHRRVQVS